MSSVERLAVVFVFAICFYGGHTKTPEQRKKCIKDFLEWCKQNEYDSKSDNQGPSVSLYNSNIDGDYVSLYCTVDYDGTECLKDKKSWYHCLPDKTLTFNGQPLTEDSEVEDEVCSAKTNAVNSGYHARFNKTAFRNQMRQFNRQMSSFNRNLNKQMSDLTRRLTRPGFPFSRYDESEDSEYDSDDDSYY